jgi:anti-sigma factor RsiW
MPTAGQHYELSDWVDYVRGVGAPERLAAMERHLTEDRCDRCARLAEMLASAYGAARSLAEVVVPARVIGRAQEIFRPQPARPWWEMAVRFGEWLDDLIPAAGEPAIAGAGVRTGGLERQRIYQSGSLQVRMEQEISAEGVRVVTGVLSDVDNPGRSYAGVPVLLVSGRRALAETVTSEFGEFELEAPSARKLGLVIPLGDSGERLEMALEN